MRTDTAETDASGTNTRENETLENTMLATRPTTTSRFIAAVSDLPPADGGALSRLVDDLVAGDADRVVVNLHGPHRLTDDCISFIGGLLEHAPHTVRIVLTEATPELRRQLVDEGVLAASALFDHDAGTTCTLSASAHRCLHRSAS